MKVLITGAAGNLGLSLTRYLLDGPHQLGLMVHRQPLPAGISDHPNTAVYQADLGRIETLRAPCKDTACIVHFAGRLFAPQPENFLPVTNVAYVHNLVSAALDAGVGKFVLVSFPHVEGETGPQQPAQGLLQGEPTSVHARTRLQAEQHLFAQSEGRPIVPVSLRSGMIYGRGVLMIEAARRLLKRRLLGVWRTPTWIHLIALPDFLRAVEAAIEGEAVAGIYNLGDEEPLTLQEFLDRVALHWGYPKPWRAPGWSFFFAAWLVEAYAAVFRTPSPLTRDFVRIGMASYVMDTTRMRGELLPRLHYPCLEAGFGLL